jgi:hypothetical protein
LNPLPRRAVTVQVFVTATPFSPKVPLSPPGETERFSEKDGVPLSRQFN